MNRLKPASFKRPKQLNFHHTKQQKYGNKKVVVDGIKFDSIAESEYYKHLVSLKKNGTIIEFEMQKSYILIDNFKHPLTNKTIRKVKYVPDFVIKYNDGTTKIIDVKGYDQDKVFRMKAKLFIAKYKLPLFLVKYDSKTRMFREEIVYG